MIRAIFFDMDGTAVRYEDGRFHSSWDALGHALVEGEPWDAALAYYYPRPELYSEWLAHNAGLLAGTRPADADPILFPAGRPPYSEGFPELIRAVRGRLVTGLITSGVDRVSRFIRRDLELDLEVSNRLLVEDGRFTGGVEERVPLWEKGRVLAETAAGHDLEPGEVAFVGDSVNDRDALRWAGLPALFRPGPDMDEFRRDYRQETGREIRILQDFRELIPLMGSG